MGIRIFKQLLFTSLLSLAQLGATTVSALNFEELTDRSEVVVHGQVTRVWSDWDSEHKYIWTHYEIAVDSAPKGAPGATVVVSEPGGVVGDVAISVSGVVSYATGEQVAVFLQRMPNGYLRTTGWNQGKFAVDKTGHLHASSARGIETIGPDRKSSLLRGTPLTALEGIGVSDLKLRVAARMAIAGGTSK
ncbi:MAG: hypothetical protein M3N93_03520 [Acidobacteriota bacterium]|nr:hypothetical protein [Acidobacteriota bacterium]